MTGLPGICRGCHLPVVYVHGRWRDPFARGLGLPHVCGLEAMPLSSARTCGAWMPYARERCARKPGHAGGRGGGHRTRYALDNDARRGVAA